MNIMVYIADSVLNVRYAVCMLALGGLLAHAQATEYFVSLDGCDETHDGRGRETAFATIQKGVDALEPGDTLTILPGEYPGGVRRDGLGSDDAVTTIRADIPGTAVLRGDRQAPVTLGYGRVPDGRQWEWKIPEIDWYRDGKAVSADVAIRAPFGAPKFLRLSDGRLLAYGRVLGPDKGPVSQKAVQKVAGGDSHDPRSCYEHASVTLFEVDPQRARLTRLADFPGYSHYHGIVEHDGMLWIACGSADNITEAWMLKVALDALPFPCEKRK